MIIVAPTKVEWTGEDAVRLKEFLNSPTGFRLLQTLAMGAPELLDGTHPNKTLVSCGRLDGYQDAISTMVRLTYENPNETPESQVVTENYQSLDDDAAWVGVDSPVDKSDEKATS